MRWYRTGITLLWLTASLTGAWVAVAWLGVLLMVQGVVLGGLITSAIVLDSRDGEAA